MKNLFVNGLNDVEEFKGWDNEEVKIAYVDFLKQFNKKDDDMSKHLFICNGAEDFVRVSTRNSLELWMCCYHDTMIPEFRDSECEGFAIFSSEMEECQCFFRGDNVEWDEEIAENGDLTLHIYNINAKEKSDIRVKINKDSKLVSKYSTTGLDDYVLTGDDGIEYRFETL